MNSPQPAGEPAQAGCSFFEKCFLFGTPHNFALESIWALILGITSACFDAWGFSHFFFFLAGMAAAFGIVRYGADNPDSEESY